MGEACIQGFSPRGMQQELIIVPINIFIADQQRSRNS
jgi:hypothetical protein